MDEKSFRLGLDSSRLDRKNAAVNIVLLSVRVHHGHR